MKIINLKKAARTLFAQNQKGMTAIEIITVLIVMTIVLAVFLLKGSDVDTDNLRSNALLKNMQFVSHAVEEQKRHLGHYPTHVKSLMDKTEFLKPNQNSGGITDETLFHSEWGGPYVRGLSIRDDDFMLDDIMAGKRGKLGIRNKTVYYEISPFTTKELPKATRLYNKCTSLSLTNTVVLNTLVTPTYNSLCGYTADNDGINNITYYIGEKR